MYVRVVMISGFLRNSTESHLGQPGLGHMHLLAAAAVHGHLPGLKRVQVHPVQIKAC